MSEQADQRHLTQIRQDIDLISKTVGQHGADAFSTDPDVRDAVLQRLYRIADSCGHLSEQLRMRHPDIDWPKVRGFRNIAAHGYAQLALPVAWDIVESHLPRLSALVDTEMQRLRDERE